MYTDETSMSKVVSEAKTSDTKLNITLQNTYNFSLTLFAVGAEIPRLTHTLARHCVTGYGVDALTLTLTVLAPLPLRTGLLALLAHLA